MGTFALKISYTSACQRLLERKPRQKTFRFASSSQTQFKTVNDCFRQLAEPAIVGLTIALRLTSTWKLSLLPPLLSCYLQFRRTMGVDERGRGYRKDHVFVSICGWPYAVILPFCLFPSVFFVFFWFRRHKICKHSWYILVIILRVIFCIHWKSGDRRTKSYPW